MHKKPLVGVIVIGLLALTMGLGTYAYFTDTGYSENNLFSSGTLILKLQDNDESWRDNVTSTWSSPANWCPGAPEVLNELDMKNTGTCDADLVSVHGENLVMGGLENRTILTTIQYTEGGSYLYGNLIGYYKNTGAEGKKMDRNQDGNVTLWEFCKWSEDYSMVFWIGGWPPTQPYLPATGAQVEKLKLGFTFDPNAGNECQGKTASFDLEVTAYQSYTQITLAGKGGTCYGYGS